MNLRWSSPVNCVFLRVFEDKLNLHKIRGTRRWLSSYLRILDLPSTWMKCFASSFLIDVDFVDSKDVQFFAYWSLPQQILLSSSKTSRWYLFFLFFVFIFCSCAQQRVFVLYCEYKLKLVEANVNRHFVWKHAPWSTKSSFPSKKCL